MEEDCKSVCNIEKSFEIVVGQYFVVVNCVDGVNGLALKRERCHCGVKLKYNTISILFMYETLIQKLLKLNCSRASPAYL